MANRSCDITHKEYSAFNVKIVMINIGALYPSKTSVCNIMRPLIFLQYEKLGNLKWELFQDHGKKMKGRNNKREDIRILETEKKKAGVIMCYEGKWRYFLKSSSSN